MVKRDGIWKGHGLKSYIGNTEVSKSLVYSSDLREIEKEKNIHRKK